MIESVLCMFNLSFSDMSMSENSDFSGLSKVYEESEKVRISLEGKKFNKIRKYAGNILNNFGPNRQRI